MQLYKLYSFLLLALLLVCGVYTKAQTLEPPVITQASVKVTADNPGAVELWWKDNNSYDIDSFRVFKLKYDPYYPINPQYVSIAVVANSISYWDKSASANIHSESYKVKSIHNKIGSDASDPHNTVYLQPIIYDSCKMTNTITWNSYIGWGNEVYYYIKDSAKEDIINITFISDTSAIHNEISPNKEYTYLIKVASDNPPTTTSKFSYSNISSIYTTPIKKPDSLLFYINSINYNGNSVDFSVNIDKDADLLGHSLMYSSSQNSGYSEVEFKKLDGNIFHHSAESQPFFYKVNAIGVCSDTVAKTQTVKPIVLIAKSNETEVVLNWNKSFIESTENYIINITVDGNAIQKSTTDLSETYTFDNLGGETAEVFCFTIQATDINSNSNTSSSNTVCVSRIPKIEAPTAFTPRSSPGLNDFFGPFWENGYENSYIKNAIVEEFKLIIYDKYGGAVFSTDNSSDKWNGTAIGGSPVTEGGYIYYLWFKTTQGKSYEKSGTINVVYP